MNVVYDYGNDPTAQKLYSFLTRWLRAHPQWATETTGWRCQYRDATAIANELVSEVEFGEVRLAGLLNTPNGELIQTVVNWVLPYPMNIESKLLFDAIMLAANAKQRNERGLAAVFSIAALVFLGLIVFSD